MERTENPSCPWLPPGARLMKQFFAYVTTSRPQLMQKAIWSPTSRWQVTRRITVFWPSIFESQRGIRYKHTWSVADKGYEDPADTSEALAAGIVPNVVSWSGADTVGVSYECRESEITDTPCQSSKPEDIRICLQAGIIPNVYAGIFVNATIKEASSFTNGDHHTDVEILCMSPKQMRKKAMKDYFVRDVQRIWSIVLPERSCG